MLIRKYKPEDCRTLSRLFYHTVHTVNAKDYSQEQLKAWSPERWIWRNGTSLFWGTTPL